MKNQYLVGVEDEDLIRVYDGKQIIGCTRGIKEVQLIKDQFKDKDIKIYKLVEVKI